MRQLTPLKVLIGLKQDGRGALYPDFNQLQVVKDSGLDWSHYVDIYGLGWHYDKTSGHKEETADSPAGQQWGMLIVPSAFVEQAVAMFPDTCQELTEAQCQAFYDEKAAIDFPDEEIDIQIVQGIKAKQDLGLALTEQQQDALNPDTDVRGIRKNKKKWWADLKELRGVEIVAST